MTAPGSVTPAHLRARLDDAPFDWLVVADPGNVTYATGYRSVGGDLFVGHRMMAVVSTKETFLIGSASDAGPATAEAVDPSHYEPFGTFHFEPPDGPIGSMAGRHAGPEAALESLIVRAGVHGVIGIDAGAQVYRSLLSGRSEVVDAVGWISSVRRRKLSVEVDVLRRVARVAEDAISAAVDAAAVGVTERELATVVARVMVDRGAMPRFLVVTSGPRSALADARATDRALEPGDLVRFDVGCTLDGYWSDIGRTAVVGPPDPGWEARYAAILAGETAQLAQARPGMTAGALFRLAVDTVEAAGLRPYRRHHCGHGIGLDVYEQPIVAPGVETPLEEGMVFCFETPFYDLEAGGMMVEDAVVINETGCEVLTVSDRSLRVIPT